MIIDVTKVGEADQFTGVFVINKVFAYMHLIQKQQNIFFALGTVLHFGSFNQRVVEFLRTCISINACSQAGCVVMGASTPLIPIWPDNKKRPLRHAGTMMDVQAPCTHQRVPAHALGIPPRRCCRLLLPK